MPRALTVNDATVLKLTMLAVLERYSTFDHIDLDDINSRTPTPAGPADQIMDAINRVRIDGKPIVRVHRTIERGETFYEFDNPLENAGFPGGARTVCLALLVRMQELIRMPVSDDERNDTSEEGLDKATLDRLAASIEILPPPDTLH